MKDQQQAMTPEDYGRYWHDLAQHRMAKIVALRDALLDARRQLLDRNGSDRDSDTRAAIRINLALLQSQ